MSKLQTVLTALNEKNFDTLSNQSLNMVKGGTCCCPPPPPPVCGAVKSRKSNKIKIKRSVKSIKSIKIKTIGNGNGYGSYPPCGW